MVDHCVDPRHVKGEAMKVDWLKVVVWTLVLGACIWFWSWALGPVGGRWWS